MALTLPCRSNSAASDPEMGHFGVNDTTVAHKSLSKHAVR
jgi:hypothetical protein